MIKVIIGLGNPGRQYYYTRHNIGFRVLDALAAAEQSTWQERDKAHTTQILLFDQKLTLVKPQTYMNSSGLVVPAFLKQGVTPQEILVVHDELELPFGKVTYRQGGSARGHNGLKSIIQACGPDFYRLRCGISRPDSREQVPDYVLERFSQSSDQVDTLIQDSVTLIESIVSGNTAC